MKPNEKKDIRKEKKLIIKNAETTLDNYESIKTYLGKARQNINVIESRITSDESYLRKTVEGFRQMPDEAFIDPSPEFETLVASGCVITASTMEHSEILRKGFSGISQRLGTMVSSAVSGSVGVTSSGVIALEAVRTIVPVYPKLEPLARELAIPTLPEKTAKAEQLLYNTAPRLKDMLIAAWQAYRDTSKHDRCKQGAHVVRELLREFLEILAPDKKVELAPWFKPETPTGVPSRRQRVKYAIQGNREENALSEFDLESINKVMTDTRDRINELSKLAHTYGDSPERLNLLNTCIVSSQEITTTILELRGRFFQESGESGGGV